MRGACEGRAGAARHLPLAGRQLRHAFAAPEEAAPDPAKDADRIQNRFRMKRAASVMLLTRLAKLPLRPPPR